MLYSTTTISFRASALMNSRSIVYLVVDGGLRVNEIKPKLPPQLLGKRGENRLHHSLQLEVLPYV